MKVSWYVHILKPFTFPKRILQEKNEDFNFTFKPMSNFGLKSKMTLKFLAIKKEKKSQFKAKIC